MSIEIQFNLTYLTASDIRALQAMLGAATPYVKPSEMGHMLGAATPYTKPSNESGCAFVGGPTPMTSEATSTTQGALTSGSTAETPLPEAAPAAAAEPPVTTGRKQGRPRKEAAVEQVDPSSTTATEENRPTENGASTATALTETLLAPTSTTEPDRKYSVDELRAALQKYTGTNGMDAGIALIESLGFARVSELADSGDTSKQKAFMVACV